MATKKNQNILNNIKVFWQGKISLKWSFWFWFVVIGTVVTLPSFILTDDYIDSLGNLALVGYILYFILQIAYLILAYVGTWRSASNYKPKKNQWHWGTIAQVYIAFNLMRAIFRFFVGTF